MHDDAKFLFFLSGFSGFVLFYIISIVIDSDPVLALIKGSIGCLILGASGRYILGFALKYSQVRQNSDNRSQKFVSHETNSLLETNNKSSVTGNQSLDQLAAATNLEALNKSKVASSLKISK